MERFQAYEISEINRDHSKSEQNCEKYYLSLEYSYLD